MSAEPTITISTSNGSISTGPIPMCDFRSAIDQMTAADRKRRKAPPVKNTPEDHAVTDQAYSVAADELRQFIEQFEHLEAEKKEIAQRQKEVMAEAKARGYSTPAMKKIIAERKRDRDDLAEESAIVEMYRAALGMA